MQTTKRNTGAFAAALIAWLMLTYASTLSNLMQVQMALPGAMTPLCTGHPAVDSMSDMEMPGLSTPQASSAAPQDHSKPDHGHGHDCPYCAAVAHLAVLQTTTPLPVCATFVFAAFEQVSGHGPRGPPQCEPRARGPPSLPTPT